MKIAIVTSNFGNFDSIKEIPKQTVEFDRFYYNESNSIFPAFTINNRLKAKIYKMLQHKILPDYDIYVWIDASIQIQSPFFIEYITKELINNETIQFSISKHPFRKTIYEEADFVINSIESGDTYLSVKFTKENILKEIQYIGEGLDGLFACGTFARRNEIVTNQMCENWFLDNVLWSACDQMNFVANINKYNIKVNYLEMHSFYHNGFYKIEPHENSSGD